MPMAKEVLDELLVNTFNHILSLEGYSMKKAGVKISITEIHILDAIKKSEVPTMSKVASKLLVTVGTLTTSVEKLVEKGYVERYNDSNDRRRVFLRLREKADEVLEKHKQFHDEMIDNLIKDLNLDHDETLINSLNNLKNYFQEKYLERDKKE